MCFEVNSSSVTMLVLWDSVGSWEVKRAVTSYDVITTWLQLYFLYMLDKMMGAGWLVGWVF